MIIIINFYDKSIHCLNCKMSKKHGKCSSQIPRVRSDILKLLVLSNQQYKNPKTPNVLS